VIGKSGLDGYFLLRYLRMMIILFGVSLLVVWPVLLPINAVNQRGAAGGVQGLDLLSISNINSPNRYWAHVIVAIAFICPPLLPETQLTGSLYVLYDFP